MVENRNLIATYGSLKRGFHNHNRCGEQVFVGETKIKGEMTLVYNSYPQLYLNEDGDEHEVEVFMVDALTFTMINDMELGAGYTPVHILTPFGEATMWVFTDKDRMRGVPIKEYSHDLLEGVSD